MALALGDFGIAVGPTTVGRLLRHTGYALRVNHKPLATDASPDRNQQFLYISDLRDRFQRRDWPIICVDTKKRELVGNFKNAGTRWDVSPRRLNDHDFRSDALGVAIPHGPEQDIRNVRAQLFGESYYDEPDYGDPNERYVAPEGKVILLFSKQPKTAV